MSGKIINITGRLLKDSAVVLLLSIILFFLMKNIDNRPLWQDEAESALNAMTITSHNIIPRAFEGTGMPMHECRLYVPEKDDPMYDWYPTAYYYSPYVTTHGWVPYYFIKLGISLFGKNELGPRFFSPVFFVMSLFILFKIMDRYSGFIIAVLTVISILLMPNMLTCALQARYFMYTLFFSTLSLLFFLRYYEKRSTFNFYAFAGSGLVLYYTNIQSFILLSLVYLACIILKDGKSVIGYMRAMAICFIGAIPHLVITKFYRFVFLLPKDREPWVSGWRCLRSVVNHNEYLIALAMIFVILYAGKAIFSGAKKNRFAEIGALELITICLITLGYPFICLTTPEMAFYERIFLPLVPFIVYAAVSAAYFYAGLLKNRYLTAAGSLLICSIFILQPVIVDYGRDIRALFCGRFAPVNIRHTDSGWVLPVIRYIKSTGARNPLILTSFEQFVFSYYSDYDAQLIWPVKKEFLDTAKRDLFIVLEGDWCLNEHAGIYYPDNKQKYYSDEKNRNYYDRIAHCKKVIIGPVAVYESLNKPV